MRPFTPGEKVVLATHNKGKFRENDALLAPYGLTVLSAGDLGLPEPEETGTSFQENAVLKARAACAATGLPAIAALRTLLGTGDRATAIEGCLSGTLGYLCAQLERGASYSAAVTQAKSLGYTEPDPREDLGGRDVARKALILARTAGLIAQAHEEMTRERPLRKIDPEGTTLVPMLMKELSSQTDPKARAQVLYALSSAPGDRRDAIPTLVRLLETEKERSALSPVISTLGTIGRQLGAEGKVVVAPLMGVLKHPESSVRIRALSALNSLELAAVRGNTALESALRELLKDEDRYVVKAAQRLLTKLEKYK